MGKRGHGEETDAELWARVAKSARPLGKRTPSPKPELPKQPPQRQAKAAASPRQPASKAVAKPAPVARGEALDRQTARQLERGRVPVEGRLARLAPVSPRLWTPAAAETL